MCFDLFSCMLAVISVFGLRFVTNCPQIINSVYGMLTKGIGASQVVFQHLARKPKFNGKGTIAKSSFRGEIEFDNVCFSYPSRPHQPVLNVSIASRVLLVV